MFDSCREVEHLHLPAGERLPDLDAKLIWRLESGAMRIDAEQLGAAPDLVCLALPGDVVGLEDLVSERVKCVVRAIVPTQLVGMSMDVNHKTELLANTISRMRERCWQAVSLRSGAVPLRVQRLLLMLSDPSESAGVDTATLNVPNLREMASLIDSAHETVSRVIGNFCEMGLLHDRKPMCLGFNRRLLREQQFVAGLTSSSRRPVLNRSAI